MAQRILVAGALVAAVFAGLVVVDLAHAEQGALALCTHREDRPDLGTPVHRTKGGRGDIRHTLRNGTPVSVLKTLGSWRRIGYNDPSPEAAARSEPRRLTGWVTEDHLRACPSIYKIIGTVSYGTGGELADLLRDDGVIGDLDDVLTQAKGVGVARPPSDTLKICWWNAKRLGDDATRDWAASARALQGCGVVGLGEVMTPAAATKLAAAIGPDWRAVTSTKGVGPPGEQERYAVLYDSDLAKVIGPESWYPDPGDVFARDPWAIDVKAGPFDFTLTLVNLVSGETAAARVAELEHVDDAWRWFQEQDPREQDVIMTGDFNREPDEEGWEQVRQAGLRLLVTGCATTIDVKGRPANLCDQMIIATQETREWTGSAGAIEDVGLGLAEFRSKVSDHLPVSATFGTQGPDDD